MPQKERNKPVPTRLGISPNFHYRLRSYIMKKHGSINAFCRAVGIKYPAQMTPYLTGKCFPGKKMIDRLKNDGADIPWLMTGNENQMAIPDLSNALSLSQYRMDIDNLFRQIRLHINRFSDIYQPIVDAYAVLDHDKNIVDLCSSLEQYLEYPKNALIGSGLKSIMHPEDYSVVKRTLDNEKHKNTIVVFKSKFKHGDGSYIKAEWCLAINQKPMSELHEYAMILKGSHA